MRKALISQGFSVWRLNRPQYLVGESGFEPLKSVTTDLQSAPFGRSGTLPYLIVNKNGAGGRIRTPDLLITNQLLYRLSYTSANHLMLNYNNTQTKYCQHFFQKIFNIKILRLPDKPAGNNRQPLCFIFSTRFDSLLTNP